MYEFFDFREQFAEHEDTFPMEPFESEPSEELMSESISMIRDCMYGLLLSFDSFLTPAVGTVSCLVNSGILSVDSLA